ncbi:LysR substrate-binding domain-containing protein [Kangiella sediminilitoris]|uniref:Transcriptional regulator, LysR family n=1 Tax=Kangiella sediminilitoris TaxID=1144748 RepID=A0A1B3BBA4_9GAMM|nr:LysR substrate-binding domain-containing protein [Kangiella sediminilitoris]AOE50046.1 Transcriptional regulator, LysR family [Kangiella sediminilitoris]
MKLQQLNYLVAIADNNLSITKAAEKLYTSQPGISKQLRLLESELETKIFERNGKQLAGITELGEEVISRARKVLHEINHIKNITNLINDSDSGRFSIATTQTQAQYVLPKVFSSFHGRYPNLTIDLQQGTSEQILSQLQKQEVDFAIASGNIDLGANIVKIPCFQWDRTVLFPHDHPLGDLKKIQLEDLAKYPIVTYPFMGNAKQSSLTDAFKKENLEPNIVFTARDADVIKTYVRNGFGIGIVASMAFSPQKDRDLLGYSTKDILPRCTTWLAFNKNIFLKKYMKDFINDFAPHISSEQLSHYIHQDYTSSLQLMHEHESDKAEDKPLPMHQMWHI